MIDDVKKWTQGGDPKKVFPLSVIIASPLSPLTWTAATAESGGRAGEKSICLLKSNYWPLFSLKYFCFWIFAGAKYLTNFMSAQAGEKSICLLKSNYRPRLLHQLLNLLNSSVTFCPLPPAKRLCQRTKFAEMRGSVCKIGEQRKKDVSILRSS